MRISCPECNAAYDVPATQLAPGRPARCARCGAVWAPVAREDARPPIPAILTPPPPLSTPEKFWGVFTPISERLHEAEKLVFGSGGEGSGGNEIVVETIIRGGSDGTGRRKGVVRALEGWLSVTGTPCELSELECSL